MDNHPENNCYTIKNELLELNASKVDSFFVSYIYSQNMSPFCMYAFYEEQNKFHCSTHMYDEFTRMHSSVISSDIKFSCWFVNKDIWFTKLKLNLMSTGMTLLCTFEALCQSKTTLESKHG